MPGEWKTIAVLPLENKTTRYRIEQRLTEAVVREFLARASYRIVANPDGADAVLRGQVLAIDSSAVLFDAATGRATTMSVTVKLRVNLTSSDGKTVVYQNDNYIFRDQYEISTDIDSFFEEQQPAMDRMARDFAARLVSAILENF